MQPGTLPPPLLRHFEAVPHLRDQLQAFLATTCGPGVPPATLERCRLAVAAAHHLPPAACGPALAPLPTEEREALAAGGDPPGLSALDRAALAIARQVPWQHHAITDAEVAAVRAELGDAATVRFLAALAMTDAVCRIARALQHHPGGA